MAGKKKKSKRKSKNKSGENQQDASNSTAAGAQTAAEPPALTAGQNITLNLNFPHENTRAGPHAPAPHCHGVFRGPFAPTGFSGPGAVYNFGSYTNFSRHYTAPAGFSGPGAVYNFGSYTNFSHPYTEPASFADASSSHISLPANCANTHGSNAKPLRATATAFTPTPNDQASIISNPSLPPADTTVRGQATTDPYPGIYVSAALPDPEKLATLQGKLTPGVVEEPSQEEKREK
ncbi:hypothetical protein B0T22DRAFT_479219 [Podospora appendiculata]|uniref:Uncharacterized protein n=1 Tax=Podospora appendiculata TaxID=314037 RepID=A0AAE1CBX5_9PEZI|nr:hypothetical protein B0T22DRAFT_479219 [Podospora appendiculata]